MRSDKNHKPFSEKNSKEWQTYQQALKKAKELPTNSARQVARDRAFNNYLVARNLKIKPVKPERL